MIDLPFERLFSMGAFDGLRSVRMQRKRSSDADFQAAIEIVRNVDPDAGGLDFQAAAQLDTIVQADASLEEAHSFYRNCISAVVLTKRLTWARSITLGREKLVSQLDRDQRQCLRAARLLEAPPPEDVVRWWDALAGEIRRSTDAKKMDMARRAESMSLAHERQRLQALGIPIEPRWVAIEDNTAGYDIHSYDIGKVEPVSRLIEVKSTTASPLRFFVTRNEWDQAVRYGTSYHFHIWDMGPESPRLYQRTVPQVLPHIPTDNERGKWTVAVIPLGAN